MRGAPQVRFSATIRKMSCRNSRLTHFRPAGLRCREIQVQYTLNPVRCHRTTVSGWTRNNACFHPHQSRRNITQKNRSETANRGCGCLRLKTVSCCRSARFSSRRSRRERKTWVTRAGISLKRRNMRQFSYRNGHPFICLIQRQRVSRTDLREPRGETPRGYSPIAGLTVILPE